MECLAHVAAYVRRICNQAPVMVTVSVSMAMMIHPLLHVQLVALHR